MARKKKCVPEFEGKKFELIDYSITPNVLSCNGLEKYATLKYTYTVSEVNEETCEVETKTYYGEADDILLSCLQNETAPLEPIVLSETVYINLTSTDGESVRTGITFTFSCEGCSGKCDNNIEFKITGTKLNKWSFDCQGGETPCTVSYIVIRTDNNCNKTSSYGEYVCKNPIVIKPCKGEGCCKEHYLSYAVVLKYNKKTGDVSEQTDTEYDEENYLYAGTGIPIIIEADKQNKCGNDCKCEPISGETTYCVKKETVQVLYPSIDENGNESWSHDGILPASGGTVMVGFDYDWFVTQTDCEGEQTDLTGTDSYVDEIEIPACDCNENDCGDIVVETEFKKPHEGDCNKFTYTVKQESCLKK